MLSDEEKTKESISQNRINITVLVILIILTGVITDFMVMKTGCICITVSDSYSYAIYSSICVMSVLCISAVALITSMLDKRYYGYKIIDILAMQNLNLKRYIILSMCLIAVATVALFLDSIYGSVNTLTSIVLALVCLEIYTISHIFDVLMNDNKCCETVEKYYNDYKATSHKLRGVEYDTNCVIAGIDDAINTNSYDNVSYLFICLRILNNNASEKEQKYIYTEIFRRAGSISLKWGYDALMHYICLLSENNLESDKTGCLYKAVNDIEFMDDKTFSDTHYIDSLIEFNLSSEYKSGKIHDELLEGLILQYFQALNSNYLLSQKIKTKALNDFWDEICCFSWIGNDFKSLPVDCTVAFYIFKDYVFKDAEGINREELMGQFLKALRKNDIKTKNSSYYYFISQICEAFYLFRFKETELVDENARLKIEALYKFCPETIDKQKLNLSWFLFNDIQKILPELGKKIIRRTKNFDIFEYFPDYMQVKYMVWTKEQDIIFSFILYNLCRPINIISGYWNLCLSGNNISLTMENKIVDTLLRLFDKDSLTYTNDFMIELEQARAFFGANYNIPTCVEQKNIFHEINKRKININESVKQTEIPDKQLVELQEEFEDYLKQKPIYGMVNTLESSNYICYAVGPFICEKGNKSEPYEKLYQSVVYAVNNCIEQFSDHTDITFDICGIEKMVRIISKNDWDTTNYSYPDDLALIEFKKTEQYTELSKKYSSLKICDTPFINKSILFKQDKLEFRFDITQLDQTELDDSNREKFLDYYKTQSGLYNIKGAVYTREEALNYLMKCYYMVSMRFNLYYKFSKQDITVLDFKINDTDDIYEA